MTRPSLKQQLITALELRIAELARRRGEGDAPASLGSLEARYRDDLRRAGELRTGPTPAWAIELALELGLPASTRSSTTSST